jgi:hypothetical protein
VARRGIERYAGPTVHFTDSTHDEFDTIIGNIYHSNCGAHDFSGCTIRYPQQPSFVSTTMQSRRQL